MIKKWWDFGFYCNKLEVIDLNEQLRNLLMANLQLSESAQGIGGDVCREITS